MCGRFTLRAPASVVAEHFALFELPPFTPRFNIAPTQPVPVIRLAPRTQAGTVPIFAPAKMGLSPSGPSAPRRELVFLRWGLIPSWAKDPSIGNRLINARAETVAEKPAFRTALRRRRCLLAADGFYEWQAAGRRKQPYFIRLRDDRPFAFAGLWETWEGRTGTDPDSSAQSEPVPVRSIESCTLLTTEPNELMRPIHDRMPAILAPDDYAAWLDPAVQEPAQLLPLLRPYPSEAMVARPVGTLVNSPANDVPECILSS
jgi:putative SOS response-associated peptidase YedK